MCPPFISLDSASLGSHSLSALHSSVSFVLFHANSIQPPSASCSPSNLGFPNCCCYSECCWRSEGDGKTLDVVVLQSQHPAQAHGVLLALAGKRGPKEKCCDKERGPVLVLSPGTCDQLNSCPLHGVCLCKMLCYLHLCDLHSGRAPSGDAG